MKVKTRQGDGGMTGAPVGEVLVEQREWARRFVCIVLSFCGPVALSDHGLYYVLCDGVCLTADKAVGAKREAVGGKCQ
jgi:hypothetical protein